MPKTLEQEQPEWLTMKQAAEKTGFSQSTLFRYEKAGLIKPRRTPTGHRRYSREDIEDIKALVK
jgi:DNA-binding transcriptional MerR regulator